ncbi:MAG: hypothetical protein M3510_09495 [Actinomycetota bacterium]|nr:hypothetical protein [Actinomycetota bacterium]
MQPGQQVGLGADVRDAQDLNDVDADPHDEPAALECVQGQLRFVGGAAEAVSDIFEGDGAFASVDASGDLEQHRVIAAPPHVRGLVRHQATVEGRRGRGRARPSTGAGRECANGPFSQTRRAAPARMTTMSELVRTLVNPTYSEA